MQISEKRFAQRMSLIVVTSLYCNIVLGEVAPQGWHMELEPYAWVPLQSIGSLTLRVPASLVGNPESTTASVAADSETTIPLDLTPSDLFGVLLPAAHLRGSLGYGPVALEYDGTYLQLGSWSNIDDAVADVNAQLFVQHGMVAFRAFRWAPLGSRAQEIELELSTGVRAAWRRVHAPLVEGLVVRDELAFEAAFGVATPVRLSDEWALAAHGLLTVPGPSWEFLGGAQWTPNSVAAIGLGYRVNSYQSGEVVVFDLVAHGPYLSVALRLGDHR